VQVIAEVVGDYGLEKFRSEFERLYYALQRVHANERLLVKKCHQINHELDDTVGKVSQVFELTVQEELAKVQTQQVRISPCLL